MKIFTVGSKSFVTSFQLAGIPGIISETPDSALTEITKLTDDSDVGLVLVSDDITESINDELTALRAQKSTLVFALPATGSEKTEVDYRAVSYTHLRAHETVLDLVCRLLLEKKNKICFTFNEI